MKLVIPSCLAGVHYFSVLPLSKLKHIFIEYFGLLCLYQSLEVFGKIVLLEYHGLPSPRGKCLALAIGRTMKYDGGKLNFPKSYFHALGVDCLQVS